MKSRLTCPRTHLLIWVTAFGFWRNAPAESPIEPIAKGVTSLTNEEVKYRRSDQHYAVLKSGDVQAVIVDNAAVDNEVLPKHRAGYNGIASLSHASLPRNVYVPSYAGVNFEHIHDGVSENLKEKFEPRKAPMELRIINEKTVELYQPPTPHFQLESCGRYQIKPHGVVEYTFECIPRARTFSRDFIGLFWASYIHEPANKTIHFRGRPRGARTSPRWIVGRTPKHGVVSSHRPTGWQDEWAVVDQDFPLTLVNHPSQYEHADAWYYGMVRGMALAQIFRPSDHVHFAQSPTGGGATNPAWDFQWFIPNYEVDKAYQLRMRVALRPFLSTVQLDGWLKEHGCLKWEVQ